MFKIRDTLCPFNLTRWNEEKKLFNCSSATNVYHCIVDERNRSGEICIQPVWVQKGYCPEYNNDANTVDTVPCDWSFGCPNGAFQSNDVYQYPVCLNKTYYDNTVYDDKPSSQPWTIIAPSVAVGVIVLLVVLIVVARLCYRKRRTKQTTNGKDEQVPLLSKEIPFYKTSIFHEANKFLKDGGKILCLIGQWGSGKSTTAKQLYNSLTGRTPIVIEDILTFDVSSCQESVIVEEPFSREYIPDIEKSSVIERVISLCKQIQKTNNIFLIITSTEKAWRTIGDEINDCLCQTNKSHCIDINWKNLSDVDRIQILHTIFEYYNQDTPFTKVEQVASSMQAKSFGFPEICTLLSRCRNFQNSPIVFLNRPLRYLSAHFERMCQSQEERKKFVLLVFMSVNDMKIDMDKSNSKLWEIFRLYGLNTTDVDLKSIIPEEFVMEEESSVYVLQHDIIKRITLITFGKSYFTQLLTFSSRKDLEGWIKHKKKKIFTTFVKGIIEASDIEPFLEINDEQWIEYQEKMGMTAHHNVR